jgi:hypothetical protein
VVGVGRISAVPRVPGARGVIVVIMISRRLLVLVMHVMGVGHGFLPSMGVIQQVFMSAANGTVTRRVCTGNGGKTSASWPGSRG